jgi:hypothetical protein
MEKVKGVKPSVSIKDQGTVNYSQPKKIAKWWQAWEVWRW